MFKRLSSMSVILLLGACVSFGGGGQQIAPLSNNLPTVSGRPLAAGSPIIRVVQRLEPVAENLCRQQGRASNCDFIIAVDDDPMQPPNAFQTVDPSGYPVIVFTISLLDATRNTDEIAFVLGHEAAHHVLGHIAQRKRQARSGAILAGIISQVVGLGADESEEVQQIAAGLSAQHYSKDFELQADALGAQIALAAGFDPIRGAAFFARLPDPGPNSSHPSNAQRYQVVVEAVKRMQGF